MANKYMKECSTSLVIEEKQIRTTKRYYTPEFLNEKSKLKMSAKM